LEKNSEIIELRERGGKEREEEEEEKAKGKRRKEGKERETKRAGGRVRGSS